MSARHFAAFFNPQSVALIGASDRPRSVGATVMHNLLAGGFAGPILPVNPKHTAVAGVLAYPDVASLPLTPDLAVVCTPPCTVPGLIAELGARGARAAVVITAGLEGEGDQPGQSLQQATLAAARAHDMRLLGPNCVGLLVPGIGLNASFAHTQPLPGNIAFVTQSGALATVVLDRAKSDGIGFSGFISLGNSVDVDCADVLEYLATDPATQAILLYLESIGDAPKFLTAARAAARAKPILAVKAGRVGEGAQAAYSHTGALAGVDAVFAAALRRAGILRVDTVEDLFTAVETLARTRPLPGERLAILTNGGGPGVMATDALVLRGGGLASLTAATLQQLNRLLPANWSHGNPVDIIGDAPPERYLQTLRVLLDDPGADAVLFLHSPSAIVPSEEIARVLAPVMAATQRNVLTCWLGGESTLPARHICASAGIPTYDSPEDAIAAFLQMVNYRRLGALVREESLPAAPPTPPSQVQAARAVIKTVLDTGREFLTEPEAKHVLAAYGIPTVATRFAGTADECAALAAELGFPLALKIVSPEISHKSEAGGVVLDLKTPAEVRAAALAMQQRVCATRPAATVIGFSVQTMVRRPRAQELILGVTNDPIFGPVILFGQGGVAVEVIADRAVALPPLDRELASELVARTRVARLLAGYRNQPPADLEAIYTTLLQVAQMVADLPELCELDINPLLADEQGVLALDARLRVRRVERCKRKLNNS